MASKQRSYIAPSYPASDQAESPPRAAIMCYLLVSRSDAARPPLISTRDHTIPASIIGKRLTRLVLLMRESSAHDIRRRISQSILALFLKYHRYQSAPTIFAYSHILGHHVYERSLDVLACEMLRSIIISWLLSTTKYVWGGY